MKSCDTLCDFPYYRLRQVSPIKGCGSNTSKEGVEGLLEPRS